MWGSNLKPQDQESRAPPTESARAPSALPSKFQIHISLLLLNFVIVCLSGMAIYYLSFYILALYIPFLNLVNGITTSVKIIKKSNLVGLNKYYFTLHEVGSLYSQESREIQSKGKGLQAVIEKMQAGNKEETLCLSWLAGTVYLTLFGTIKEQESKSRARVVLAFGDCLDIACFWPGEAFMGVGIV